jgi:hypothetical protein
MLIKDVISAVRKHRGTIYVGVLARNDVFYVKVVKRDLLIAIAGMVDNEIYAKVSHGVLHIDAGESE